MAGMDETTCSVCGSACIHPSDNFCRNCGDPQNHGTQAANGRRSKLGSRQLAPRREGNATLFLRLNFILQSVAGISVILVLAASVGLASHGVGECSEGGEDCTAEYGPNVGLWHKVGELFSREQARQRKLHHETADSVENGPKEISIFCPQDPKIRISDLDEDERNRDECLVLNIAAPQVSSRLVLFCHAHKMAGENNTEAQDPPDLD